MCGIAGILTLDQGIDINERLALAESIQSHRGPDFQGTSFYNEGDWRLGLAHQRLSILDLSESGAQPMESDSGDSSIIYNGEVYNYIEIRQQLSQANYGSNTDTEVIINALEELGITDAVTTFNGMWAFAWYSKIERKLYLCRDRAGIKPLYYYDNGTTLYFASEIKAILEASSEKFSLNIQAAGEYLQQSLQDTHNNSFYSEIHSVPAGHYFEIDLSDNKLNYKTVRYWDVLAARPVVEGDLSEHVHNLFNDAVSLRMRSDVPVGVTLSGGIDSSAIASSMMKHLGSSDNLNILSAVSPGSDGDESEFIDEMSHYLGAKIHKVELDWSADDAVELLKKVTWHNDSPLGSFSNVAHFLLMKRAKELGITVILSGQGADELLCGYKKYLGFYIGELIQKKRVFKAVSVLIGFVLNRSIVTQFSIGEAKRYLPKMFTKRDGDVRGIKLKDEYMPKFLGLKSKQSMNERQADDLEKFSVPFLTHYEDRMSMAWSREIRLPFLDYRLMELFVNLPTDTKLQKGWTKYILRQAMVGMLPARINWRKDKQGFTSPQESWLKKELREDVLRVFSEDALIFSLGLIDRTALIKKYDVFCTQKYGKGQVWYREIFAPFAFEIWLQLNRKYLKL